MEKKAGTDEKASSLGERGIIDLIWSALKAGGAPAPQDLPLPHPDDASALRLGDGRLLVLKTDMFVKRTDAPKGMRHRSMGWKAITMCISDMAAKGAKPAAAMIALGVPRGCSAGALRELFRGISEASMHYGTPVLGGDVGEARDLCVSTFIAGYANSQVRRSGAKPGDIIAVTGKFGNTCAAYKILLEGLSADARLRKEVCKSAFKPVAHLAEGLALADSGCLSSSMDSSDGLAFTLHSLSRSSGCGFELSCIPISNAALEFASLHALRAEDLALFGGEEYELVVTIPPARWGEARSIAEGVGGCLIPIGAATVTAGVRVKADGGTRAIADRGWEHLR